MSGMFPSDLLNRARALSAVAALLLCAGVAASIRVAVPTGVDFASLYVMGQGIAAGTNIYDPAVALTFPARYHVTVPAGMFYPPATGFTMLPFALLPFGLARLFWLAAILLVLLSGVRALVKCLRPNAPGYVWALCAGGILLTSALRWAMLLLQGAPLVLGLLCWFVAALHAKRPRLALALAATAVAVKMTLSLPFLGILLLRRRFGAAAASVGTWVVLNVLGFMRMGRDAFHDYQGSVGKLEAFGDINSPDPWNLNTSPRLDWTSLFYGLSGNLPESRLATLALAGLVSLWLFREALRTPAPLDVQSTALFLTPLVCLGSLCVYHHHYDSGLFFASLLLLYFAFDWRVLKGPGLWLMLPLAATLFFLPVGMTQSALLSLLGAHWVGLMKIWFPICFSSALLGSLVLLARERARSSNNPLA